MSDFEGPTQSGAVVSSKRSDTMYRAREARKSEDAKSPLEKRVDALEKIIANGALFNCGAGIDIAGDMKQGFAANVVPWTPPQNVDPVDQYPWLESLLDPSATTDDPFYDVIMGVGQSSFATSPLADAIKCFEVQVLDPNNSAASGMYLVIGDANPLGNDYLEFFGNGNAFLFSWWDIPSFGWNDLNGNTLVFDSNHCDFESASGAFFKFQPGSQTIKTANGDSLSLIPPTGSGAQGLVSITISGTTFIAFQ